MSIVSYAQNFEDVMLWRALGHLDQGQYLDIGAHDPVIDSVSLAFYEAGWRGIHVEPTPHNGARLRESRPDETVIEAAVTDAPGPIIFYEIPKTGLSTGKAEIAAHQLKLGFEAREIVVPSVRLDKLFGMIKGDIHWMKIDVEGMESDVLRSWGRSQKRPWVLVIEATYPSSQKRTNQLWLDEATRRGYREVLFDGLNLFLLHEAHEALAKNFSSPPNVFDAFAISPVHFAAREVARTYQGHRDAANAEATERENGLRQSIEDARLRAQSAAVDAEAAIVEREVARGEASNAKMRLEIAIQEHQGTIASMTAESARLSADFSAAIERVVDAEREHRETVSELWRERQKAEANLLGEAREIEERLQTSLRDAAILAESTHSELIRKHAAEVVRFNEETLVSTKLFFAERAHQELKLRREFEQALRSVNLQAAEEKRETQLVVAELQKLLGETQASAVAAREQQIATLHQLSADQQEHRNVLSLLQRSNQAAEAKLSDELREVEFRLRLTISESEASAASAEAELGQLRERSAEIESQLNEAVEGSRRDAEQFCIELGQATTEAEHIRWALGQETAETARLRQAFTDSQVDANRQIAFHRNAVEEASDLIRAVVTRPRGRWEGVGEALGLARPPNVVRALAGWYPPVTDQPDTYSINSEPAQESKPTMYSPAPRTARNPYLRAESLAELLSMHDVDFVRCAFVTVLGRKPEADGETYYTDKVRRGISKLEIIARLRFSREGGNHDPGIAGLDQTLRQYRRSTIPWLGGFFQRSKGAQLEGSSVQQLRTLENAVGLLLDESREMRRYQEEHRDFRDQQAARASAEAEGLRAIMTSFVGEFRAYRDEQAARANADAEGLRAIMTSFVGEFRAFRGEQEVRTDELAKAIRTSDAGGAPAPGPWVPPVAIDHGISRRAEEIFAIMARVR